MDNLETFENFQKVNEVNEAATSGFNYEVLKDFCTVRNTAIAGHGGPDPSPRLEFIMNLLDQLGIEYELDVWPKIGWRPEGESGLQAVFGFGPDEIDDVLHSAPREWTEQELEEERNILINAFDWFEEDLDDIKALLRTAETNRESKRKKRMLNTLIRIKSEQAEQQEDETKVNNFFNIYLKGSSNKMIMAHHDVANPGIDNCNDNSASVINAISCKLLMPDVQVAITDGEENGGHGARRTAEKIKEGHFGDIEFVLNFELTAVGGTDFFIEDYPASSLQQRVTRLFPGIDVHRTPFHDGIVLRSNGIDSVVINPLPRKPDGRLDMELLYYCHSPKDTINLANFDDMKDFCEKVVVPIIRDTTPPHLESVEPETEEIDSEPETI